MFLKTPIKERGKTHAPQTGELTKYEKVYYEIYVYKP